MKVGVALFQVGLRTAQAIVFPSSQVERDGPDAQTENLRGLLTWFFLLDSVEGWAPVTRQILRNAGVGGMFAVGKVCRAVRLMTLLLEYIWGGLRRMGCSREFPVAALLQLLGAFDRLEKSLQVLRAGQQQTAGQGTASGVTGQGSGYHTMAPAVAGMMAEELDARTPPLSDELILEVYREVARTVGGLLDRLGIKRSVFCQEVRNKKELAQLWVAHCSDPAFKEDESDPGKKSLEDLLKVPQKRGGGGKKKEGPSGSRSTLSAAVLTRAVEPPDSVPTEGVDMAEFLSQLPPFPDGDACLFPPDPEAAEQEAVADIGEEEGMMQLLSVVRSCTWEEGEDDDALQSRIRKAQEVVEGNVLPKGTA
uniref:Uncharacterized protein n=1 Tax=Chromera velia CCMP2878 TaxID=1169474 RepID=A0A0G4HF18_9ALVE|eukprot:Cvel_26793.t1-p1 / transcript=Cvel_26793.t1 / gene=Cvel_26793 / organism=Chromera_velia_CCMP2878 / gene_product=hypothetical protein / transcript_product=hypothetical protein / location=Cvel_scaffold3243:14789-16071(+) / protein_length=364 / sequence_SO=supercontig / SO=protein_coding / is_pseudo=false